MSTENREELLNLAIIIFSYSSLLFPFQFQSADLVFESQKEQLLAPDERGERLEGEKRQAQDGWNSC
jgi:hypothetical protein